MTVVSFGLVMVGGTLIIAGFEEELTTFAQEFSFGGKTETCGPFLSTC